MSRPQIGTGSGGGCRWKPGWNGLESDCELGVSKHNLKSFPLTRSGVKGESVKRGHNTKGLYADGKDTVGRGKLHMQEGMG